jgi:carbon-monoxide dehydrogenase large subunit
MGAYLHGPAAVIPTNGGTRLLSNVYKIDTHHASTLCVFTNTVPIGAYRGAGKPEFAHLVELLVDNAARELGIEPAALRRKNMIVPADLPFDTPQGLTYDSGDFELAMDMALRMGEVADVEERRQDAMRRGRRLGFGFAVFTEPDGFMDNRVSMSFDATGALQVTTTGQTGGQGYETVFAQIATSLLGVPMDQVELVQGDTARVGTGKGTGGSRVTTVSGAGMHECSISIIEKGTLIAAHLLQAEVSDIVFESGRFNVVDSERGLNVQEVARAAFDSGQLPPDMPIGLSAEKHYVASAYCYPSGCHVCEIEIDVETGFVEIVRYVQLSDFGTVVNPMLLEGQIHGGVAQGIGQVLYEDAVYDSASGQLLSGSFMDYCLPRATQLPNYQCERLETWCTTNPLGVKGCGECGTTGSLPAVMNAVRDALNDCDLSGFNMPLTPEKIWRVLSSQ